MFAEEELSAAGVAEICVYVQTLSLGVFQKGKHHAPPSAHETIRTRALLLMCARHNQKLVSEHNTII